ncbi:MAG: aminopeptidase P family protein [Anaerolineales bacterium]|nr:aminopeptidase P family protein [Anaerolineales bacterium]
MKSDLDRFMAEREIDVAIISGVVRGNPIMYYMTNGANISGGIVVKPIDRAPVLVHSPIERDEAAQAGLETINMGKYNRSKLQQEAGSVLGGAVLFYKQLFEDLDVSGRIAFYGEQDQGKTFTLLNELKRSLPDITIIGEFDWTIFDQAQMTKDAQEIERMKDVGRKTSETMQSAVAFIQQHRVNNGLMVKQDNSPLTIGDVKQHVTVKLLENGLEDAEGMIFAIGRDAGVPHSKGNDFDPLKLGESIVFDLFPREVGGGYFHDMTRTFAIGHASPELRHVYDQVKLCYDKVVSELKVNELGKTYQELACTIFEEMGHPTIRTDPQSEDGYVHSLGHGVGLEIHSRPRLTIGDIHEDRLVPGSVFSIEPGLYYPDKGYGVRLEDLWTVDEQGNFSCLTVMDQELVIPV